MMTKQQYIDYWVSTAENDWVTVDVLFERKRYSHCLFWAHLVLEKIAKAHWVKNHEENIPPKVHNIVWLLEESEVKMPLEDITFLEIFNRFQLSTRYPDYLRKIDKLCTEELTINQLNKVKEIRQCLLKML
ncbi:MAG: HEPN domain-containing protein [Bacteroidetes bacterium]|nr:HEPN domain-containing protein [Bacteroidota bacterium]